MHFLLISENEFFHEIKPDGIMWWNYIFAWNSWIGVVLVAFCVWFLSTRGCWVTTRLWVPPTGCVSHRQCFDIMLSFHVKLRRRFFCNTLLWFPEIEHCREVIGWCSWKKNWIASLQPLDIMKWFFLLFWVFLGIMKWFVSFFSRLKLIFEDFCVLIHVFDLT